MMPWILNHVIIVDVLCCSGVSYDAADISSVWLESGFPCLLLSKAFTHDDDDDDDDVSCTYCNIQSIIPSRAQMLSVGKRRGTK